MNITYTGWWHGAAHADHAGTAVHGEPVRARLPGRRELVWRRLTSGLTRAAEELAPLEGRIWRGGMLPVPVDSVESVSATLGGFLESTQSSIILRVQTNRHWIVVDKMLADGSFAVRVPERLMSEIMTSAEILALRLSGEAVLNVPVRR